MFIDLTMFLNYAKNFNWKLIKEVNSDKENKKDAKDFDSHYICNDACSDTIKRNGHLHSLLI
ncbi:hypothetical protein DMZ48_08420 [Robertkochia solimangrovi]|nr:hypothetical protein DMZ48_08420 [Robertkochia solimangrovi]